MKREVRCEQAVRLPGFRLGSLRGRLVALTRKIRRWRQLSYERRLLGSLDSRMLRDIGISRAEAQRESARPFWDDPQDENNDRSL